MRGCRGGNFDLHVHVAELSVCEHLGGDPKRRDGLESHVAQ